MRGEACVLGHPYGGLTGIGEHARMRGETSMLGHPYGGHPSNGKIGPDSVPA